MSIDRQSISCAGRHSGQYFALEKVQFNYPLATDYCAIFFVGTMISQWMVLDDEPSSIQFIFHNGIGLTRAVLHCHYSLARKPIIYHGFHCSLLLIYLANRMRMNEAPSEQVLCLCLHKQHLCPRSPVYWAHHYCEVLLEWLVRLGHNHHHDGSYSNSSIPPILSNTIVKL